MMDEVNDGIKNIEKNKCLKKQGFNGLYVNGKCSCLFDDQPTCEKQNDSCLPGYLINHARFDDTGDNCNCDIYIGKKIPGKMTIVPCEDCSLIYAYKDRPAEGAVLEKCHSGQ